MNSGIIRYFDPLGRIVIPKEIRRSLHLDEITPMEIHLSGKSIMLEPYGQIPDMKNLSEAFLKVAARELDMAAAICSLDAVAFYHGFSLAKKDMALSSEIQSLIREQIIYEYQEVQPIYLTPSGDIMINALYPIGTPAKPEGALAILRMKDRNPAPEQTKTAGIIAKILTELINY